MTLVTGYISAPVQAGEGGAVGRAARVKTYMSGTGYDSADSGGDGLPSVAKTAPTPSDQRQRRSPSDDMSTDLTPLDSVAYRTLPLPRVRVRCPCELSDSRSRHSSSPAISGRTTA